MNTKTFLSNLLFLLIISNVTFGQYDITIDTYTLQDRDVTVEDGVITSCITSATDWGTGKLIIPDSLDGQMIIKIADGNMQKTYLEKKGLLS